MSTSLSFFGLFSPSSRKSRSSRRPRRKLDLSLQCEQLEIKIAPANLAVVDPGFALPALQTGTFKYDPPTGTLPTNTPWTFTGSSGVSSNNSGFTGSQPAPQGNQVAFLQQYGSISQSVPVATPATTGPYVLTFQAADRANNGVEQENFAVLIDGSVVGTFAPSSTSYQSCSTVAFPVIAGSTPTITFQGLDSVGGDNTAFIDQVAVATPSSPSIGDPTFGQPVVGAGNFQYDPITGPPATWVFTGGSGISGNNSGFTSGNPNAPQGAQVAFLQGDGSFTQNVANLVAGPSYVLTFDAAQRGNNGVSQQDFEVLIDGSVVGTFTPSSTSYQSYSTAAFTVAGDATTNHTITFQGLDSAGGDNTAFLDATTLTVNQASTTTGLVSSLNPSVSGQSVTFTATVAAVSPGSGTPTGTVTFDDNGTPLSDGTVTLSSGVASFTTSSLAVGTQSITAVYSGDTNFTISTSSAVSQVVNLASSTTALTSSANPSTSGQSVTFTATVAAVSPGSGTPTGTVNFLDGTTTIGTDIALNSSGVATIATSTLTAGTHSITAVYSGDTNFTTSTGSLTQTVVVAPTVTALSPTSGSTEGGLVVTITGTGFIGALRVHFGTTAQTELMVVNSTTMRTLSPAGTGTVDVTVTTPGGTSATSADDKFTYT